MKSKQDESKLAATAADLRNLSDIALVQLKRAHDAQRDLLFDIQASLNRTSCPSDLDQAESVAWLVTEVERLHHLEALLSQAAAEVTAHTFTAGGIAGLRAEVERLTKDQKMFVEANCSQAYLLQRIAAAFGTDADDELPRVAASFRTRAERAERELVSLKAVLVERDTRALSESIRADAAEAKLKQSRAYDGNRAEVAAAIWEKLATFEGEDNDSQLIIEHALAGLTTRAERAEAERAEAELAKEREKVSLLREACERLRGYDRLDIGLGDLHSFVNETVTDVLAATADVK